MVLCRGRVIDLDDLPSQIREKGSGSTLTLTLPITLDEAEKRLILDTISFCGGNKTKAAELLEIGRKTLHRKLAEYTGKDEE